jgi:hypothetical protein
MRLTDRDYRELRQRDFDEGNDKGPPGTPWESFTNDELHEPGFSEDEARDYLNCISNATAEAMLPICARWGCQCHETGIRTQMPERKGTHRKAKR